MGVTEKSPNVPIFWPSGSAALDVSIRSFSRIRGDDPTMVIVPPRMAQKPIGIKRRLRGSSVRTEMRLTTGRNRAAAPTFCMNDEMTPTVPEIMGMIRVSVVPPYFRMTAATLLISPVLSNPAPMIITAMIEITAFDAKPSKMWVGSARFPNPGSWDSIPSATITMMAVKSIRNTSVINRTTVTPSSANTTVISVVSSIGVMLFPPSLNHSILAKTFRSCTAQRHFFRQKQEIEHPEREG